MSTLKVDGIRSNSASSDAITLASDGTCTANITNNLSNRNKIINGAMQISQRNGTSSTNIETNNVKYHLDRYAIQGYGLDELSAGVAQSTDSPDGFAHSLKITVNTPESSIAADEYVSLYQKMEGQDFQDLAYGTSGAKDITMSFYVKSSITGTFAFTIYRDESTDRIINKTYTINSANTWERKVITIAGDTSSGITNDNSARWWNVWHLGAGSNWTSVTNSTWGNYSTASWVGGSSTDAVLTTNGATWAITGVQLEVSSVATAFEHRSISDELLRCQRYFETTYDHGIAVGTANSNGMYQQRDGTASTVIRYYHISYKVKKRQYATHTFYRTGTGAEGIVLDSTDKTALHSSPGMSGFMFYCNNGGGLSHYGVFCHWTADAEL